MSRKKNHFKRFKDTGNPKYRLTEDEAEIIHKYRRIKDEAHKKVSDTLPDIVEIVSTFHECDSCKNQYKKTYMWSIKTKESARPRPGPTYNYKFICFSCAPDWKYWFEI